MTSTGFFDTHCHLQDSAFDEDRAEMLTRSRQAGISHFLVPATDRASIQPTLELSASESNIFCGLGIHPHSANEWNIELRESIKTLAVTQRNVVAIGEIGLDYHYDFSPRDVQRKAFSEQIELAIELGKPVIIHTRESEDDVFRIIEEHYAPLAPEIPRGQFHCFSAGMELMQRAVSLGFYVSFTGNITFKKSTLAEIVRETPIDRLLIETDSPYLAPVPERGKRNSPAYLPFIAEKVAELKQTDISTIMHQTFANAVRLFRIPFVLTMFLLAIAGITPTYAQQPAGSLPPDSVLTGDRRKAEELRKKQEEELAQQAEQHRQDSIKAAKQQQEDAFARARQQLHEDSLHAMQKEQEEAAHAALMLTPQPWRAIGLGANIGGGSMHIGTPVLVPTSVFAYGFQAMTAVTRRLDLSLSLTHFVINGDFSTDSIYNHGIGTPIATNYTRPDFGPETRLVRSETLGTTAIGLDLHYDITRPTSAIRFYFGVGFQHLMMKSSQHFYHMVDTLTPLGGNASPVDSISEQDWSRNGIDLLFGMKHDFELGGGYTLEPFAEISATGVFNGPFQDMSFVLQPDITDLILVNFRAGITLYYGWWGVPREE